MNRRDKKQDMIKGLGILAVIDFHLIVFPSEFEAIKVGPVSSLMLIFFLFSGMNYTPGKRPAIVNIQNRAKNLLLPLLQYMFLVFFIFGIIYALKGVMTPAESLRSLIRFLAFGFEMENTTPIVNTIVPSWFLVYLLFASIPFFLIAPKVAGNSGKTWGTILVLIAVSSIFAGLNINIRFWHLQTLPALVAVLLLGMECKRLRLMEKLPRKPLPAAVTFLLSAAVAAVSFEHFGGANLLGNGLWGNSGFWSVPLAIGMLVMNLLTFYSLAVILEKIPKIGEAAVWLGSHSLTLLLMHLPLATLISLVSGWSFRGVSQEFSPVNYGHDILISLGAMILAIFWCVFADWCKSLKMKSGKS